MRGSSEIGATLEVSAHRPSEMNGETFGRWWEDFSDGEIFFAHSISLLCEPSLVCAVCCAVLAAQNTHVYSLWPDRGHARSVPDSTNCREGCPRPKTKCGGSDATSKPDNSQLGFFF